MKFLRLGVSGPGEHLADIESKFAVLLNIPDHPSRHLSDESAVRTCMSRSFSSATNTMVKLQLFAPVSGLGI